MHDALQTESTEQLQNILTELCTSVITEEDCKNQVIQDALNVSCDEEMNNLLEKIIGDFSPEKKDNEECSKISEENKPHFSLEFEESCSEKSFTERTDDDCESVVVSFYYINFLVFNRIGETFFLNNLVVLLLFRVKSGLRVCMMSIKMKQLMIGLLMILYVKKYFLLKR